MNEYTVILWGCRKRKLLPNSIKFRANNLCGNCQRQNTLAADHSPCLYPKNKNSVQFVLIKTNVEAAYKFNASAMRCHIHISSLYALPKIHITWKRDIIPDEKQQPSKNQLFSSNSIFIIYNYSFQTSMLFNSRYSFWSMSRGSGRLQDAND